jgi:hypothetical protein
VLTHDQTTNVIDIAHNTQRMIALAGPRSEAEHVAEALPGVIQATLQQMHVKRRES